MKRFGGWSASHGPVAATVKCVPRYCPAKIEAISGLNHHSIFSTRHCGMEPPKNPNQLLHTTASQTKSSCRWLRLTIPYHNVAAHGADDTRDRQAVWVVIAQSGVDVTAQLLIWMLEFWGLLSLSLNSDKSVFIKIWLYLLHACFYVWTREYSVSLRKNG